MFVITLSRWPSVEERFTRTQTNTHSSAQPRKSIVTHARHSPRWIHTHACTRAQEVTQPTQPHTPTILSKIRTYTAYIQKPTTYTHQQHLRKLRVHKHTHCHPHDKVIQATHTHSQTSHTFTFYSESTLTRNFDTFGQFFFLLIVFSVFSFLTSPFPPPPLPPPCLPFIPISIISYWSVSGGGRISLFSPSSIFRHRGGDLRHSHKLREKHRCNWYERGGGEVTNLPMFGWMFGWLQWSFSGSNTFTVHCIISKMHEGQSKNKACFEILDRLTFRIQKGGDELTGFLPARERTSNWCFVQTLSFRLSLAPSVIFFPREGRINPSSLSRLTLRVKDFCRY